MPSSRARSRGGSATSCRRTTAQAGAARSPPPATRQHEERRCRRRTRRRTPGCAGRHARSRRHAPVEPGRAPSACGTRGTGCAARAATAPRRGQHDVARAAARPSSSAARRMCQSLVTSRTERTLFVRTQLGRLARVGAGVERGKPSVTQQAISCGGHLVLGRELARLHLAVDPETSSRRAEPAPQHAEPALDPPAAAGQHDDRVGRCRRRRAAAARSRTTRSRAARSAASEAAMRRIIAMRLQHLAQAQQHGEPRGQHRQHHRRPAGPAPAAASRARPARRRSTMPAPSPANRRAEQQDRPPAPAPGPTAPPPAASSPIERWKMRAIWRVGAAEQVDDLDRLAVRAERAARRQQHRRRAASPRAARSAPIASHCSERDRVEHRRQPARPAHRPAPTGADAAQRRAAIAVEPRRRSPRRCSRTSISAGTGIASLLGARPAAPSHGSSSASSSSSRHAAALLRRPARLVSTATARLGLRARVSARGLDDLHGHPAGDLGRGAVGESCASARPAAGGDHGQRDHDRDDPRHRPGEPRLRHEPLARRRTARRRCAGSATAPALSWHARAQSRRGG